MAWKFFKNQARAGKNLQQSTVLSETSVENPNLEDSLYDLVMESRFAEHFCFKKHLGFICSRNSQNCFIVSGYCLEDGINYEMEMEMETESNSDWFIEY